MKFKISKKRIIIGLSLVIFGILIIVIRWDFFKLYYTDLGFWILAVSVVIIIFLSLKSLIDKLRDKFL